MQIFFELFCKRFLTKSFFTEKNDRKKIVSNSCQIWEDICTKKVRENLHDLETFFWASTIYNIPNNFTTIGRLCAEYSRFYCFVTYKTDPAAPQNQVFLAQSKHDCSYQGESLIVPTAV